MQEDIKFICFVFITIAAISVSYIRYKLEICSELTSSIERIFSFLEGISELSHVYNIEVKGLLSKETIVPRWK